MTKKQLEKRVTDLERELSELKSQMLTLSLQRNVTFIPIQPQPSPAPYVPWTQPWQPAQPQYPIITCQAQQNIQ
jgi:hypothetical protein